MSNSNNNQINISQAREACDLGTRWSRRCVRTEQHNRIARGHALTVQCIASISI